MSDNNQNKTTGYQKKSRKTIFLQSFSIVFIIVFCLVLIVINKILKKKIDAFAIFTAFIFAFSIAFVGLIYITFSPEAEEVVKKTIGQAALRIAAPKPSFLTTDDNGNLSKFDPSGEEKLNNDFRIEGKMEADEMKINGNITVTGNSTVAGNSTIAGTSSITGNLNVNGDSTIKGNISGGNISSNGNLTVTGNSNINGDSTIKGKFTCENKIIQLGRWKIDASDDNLRFKYDDDQKYTMHHPSNQRGFWSQINGGYLNNPTDTDAQIIKSLPSLIAGLKLMVLRMRDGNLGGAYNGFYENFKG